jgi:oligosaccharyltransferase complex subunit beta
VFFVGDGLASVKGFDVKQVVEFIDSGHDVVLAGTGTFISSLGKEVGVTYESGASTRVVDHFAYDSKDDENRGDHTLVVAREIKPIAGVFGPGATPAPVLFSGSAHRLTDKTNKLVTPVVLGAVTTYSAKEGEAFEAPSGQLVLVSAMQARNNARVVVSGSTSFLSDRFFTSPINSVPLGLKLARSGNEVVAGNLIGWALHDRGDLRIRSVRHHKVGENTTSVYRIRDDLEFELFIEELVNGQWVPFSAKDVQLDFTMLDPHVRVTLTCDEKTGRFHTAFKVPDVYGIFQFKIDYRREGYTYLAWREQVTVRPYLHNEYERFILTAYPYYAATFTLMAGFLIFGFFFLYSKDTKQKKDD